MSEKWFRRSSIAVALLLACVVGEPSQSSESATPTAPTPPVAAPARPRAADQSGPTNPRRVLFHPRDASRLLVVGAGASVSVWNVAQPDKPFKETAIATSAIDAAFAPDGQSIVTANRDGSAHCWSVDGKETWRSKSTIEATLYAVATTTRPPLIAVGGTGGRIHLLKPDGEEVTSLEGHNGVVLSLAFSPHGAWLASDGSDTLVRLWRRLPEGGYGQTRSFRATNEKYQKMLPNLVRLDVQWGWGETVAFSGDEELLLMANFDGTAQIWKRDSTPWTQPFTNHDHQHVRAVAYSPLGDVVATAGFDGTVRLWKPDGLPYREEPIARHGHVATSVSFSADGKRIATTGLDDRVALSALDGSSAIELPEGRLVSPPVAQ